MGYDQTTNLFYGQEVEGKSWLDFEHLPYGEICYHFTGCETIGNRHWIVTNQSFIQLSAGKWETNDAVNITYHAWLNLENMLQWNQQLEDYIKEYDLKTISIPGWIAAAHGS